jgi:ferritin-like metal-binding protein YciE
MSSIQPRTIMEQNEQLITWLRDAHAMERDLEMVLARHIEDARDMPEMHARLERHRDDTRRHAARITECLATLGATPSLAKSTLGAMMGAVQGISTVVFADKVLKNALADYAMEHLEIGLYSSLIAAAEEAGCSDIASTCSQILREETELVQWLEDQIPELTRAFLRSPAMKA